MTDQLEVHKPDLVQLLINMRQVTINFGDRPLPPKPMDMGISSTLLKSNKDSKKFRISKEV